MRYTIVTATPEGYGKAFVDAESDSQALWKAYVVEVLGKSDVVCVIPGEVYPMDPKSCRRAMAATANDSAATASDAMENQNAERCARLDASDCSRMDSSCSRMASDCDSMVRSSCMKAGSSSSVAGSRSKSMNGGSMGREVLSGNGSGRLRSVSMVVSIASLALSGAAMALSVAAALT